MIIIKGMEMPKNCHSCPMCLMRFCQAGDRELSEREIRPNAKRPEDCPFIEIPEPHGRLGDLDELKTAFPCGEYVRTESVRATIDHMRTVIPASEEG